MRITILVILIVFFFKAPVMTQGSEGDTIRLPGNQESVTAGKALFYDHCAICHAVTHEIIGPALASIPQKRPLPWLVEFIRSSQQVIASGDEYARQLYTRYNKVVMPDFRFLSDDQILSILAYVQEASVQDNVQSESQEEPFEEVARVEREPDRFSRSMAVKSYQTDMGAPLYLSVLYVTLIISLVVFVWLGIRIFKNTH